LPYRTKSSDSAKEKRNSPAICIEGGKRGQLTREKRQKVIVALYQRDPSPQKKVNDRRGKRQSLLPHRKRTPLYRLEEGRRSHLRFFEGRSLKRPVAERGRSLCSSG